MAALFILHAVRSGVLQLYCLPVERKQILMAAILIFQHVVRSGDLQLCYTLLTNTDGRHLDFQHVVRSGDLQLCYLS